MKKDILASISINSKLLILILFLNFLSTLAHSESNDSKNLLAPFSIPTQYPLHMLHLSQDIIDTEVARNRSFLIDYVWSNTFIAKSNYSVDAETRSIYLKYVLPLANNFDVKFSLPFIWRGGGILDNSIEAWHDLFDFSQGGRDEFPSNRYLIRGVHDDGNVFNLSESGNGFSNPKISLLYKPEFLKDLIIDSAFSFNLSLPTLESSFGHQGLDASFQIPFSYKKDYTSIYSGFSYVYYSDQSISGIQYVKHHIEGYLQLVYQLKEYLSFIAGATGSSKIVEGLEGHTSDTYYLDLALRLRLDKERALRFLFRENLSSSSSTADFSFSIGLEFCR